MSLLNSWPSCHVLWEVGKVTFVQNLRWNVKLEVHPPRSILSLRKSSEEPLALGLLIPQFAADHEHVADRETDTAENDWPGSPPALDEPIGECEALVVDELADFTVTPVERPDAGPTCGVTPARPIGRNLMVPVSGTIFSFSSCAISRPSSRTFCA